MSENIRIGNGGTVLSHAGLSDIGRRREHNEDATSFVAGPLPNGPHIIIVADGVGGNNAGEVASRLAVEIISEEFFAAGEPVDVAAALRRSLEIANATIVAEGAADPEQAGMATTCTCVAIGDESLYIGHLGDCRLYVARTDGLECLTSDHTLAAEYEMAEHELPPEQRHLANVLSRWLGREGAISPDILGPLPFPPGDTLVLCSDGLVKVVNENEILRIGNDNEPAEACRLLVDLANERGGPDNITVQVARLVPAPAAADQ